MKSFLCTVLMLLVLGASSASAQTKITFVGWGNESRYHELFDAAFKAFPELGEKYKMQYVMAPQDTDAVAKLRSTCQDRNRTSEPDPALKGKR
jgi:ABC-type glycerol-3-phosphate transport system substrate-binding protein